MPLLSSETIISLFMNVMTIIVGKVFLNFPIAQMLLGGKLVAYFDSIRDAAKITGFSYSGIYACVNGKKRESKGFCVEEDRKVVCIYVYMLDICFICLFSGVLTHFILFVVQLVVLGNFNRLRRKYECFRVFKKWRSYVPVWVENKKLETFSRKIWWFCRRLLTLHPETKNQLSYEHWSRFDRFYISMQ